MLSERGNPSMNNIAAIFNAVSKNLNVQIQTNIVVSHKKRKSVA
jgi:DNA-binding phage protein